jgi:hypothetical protein
VHNTYTRLLRRTTRHLAQRGLTDERTLMIYYFSL